MDFYSLCSYYVSYYYAFVCMKTTLCNLCCNVFFSSLIVHLKLSSVSIHSVKIFHITLLDPLSSHDSAVRMVSHWNWGRWFSLVIYQGFAGEAAHLWAPQIQHTLREISYSLVPPLVVLFRSCHHLGLNPKLCQVPCPLLSPGSWGQTHYPGLEISFPSKNLKFVSSSASFSPSGTHRLLSNPLRLLHLLHRWTIDSLVFQSCLVRVFL